METDKTVSKPLFDQFTFKEIFRQNRDKGFHAEENSPAKQMRLLAMVIGEISGALEAIRINQYANLSDFKKGGELNIEEAFELFIKNTFQDELADIVIRLFDYAGCFKLHFKSIESEYQQEMKSWANIEIKDIPAFLFTAMKTVTDIYYSGNGGDKVGEVIGKIHSLANSKGIDLVWHIDQKLAYNKTRPERNGKEF
jgi:NTP pyrophosphatase (non-canonical NTP hydrolase)